MSTGLPEQQTRQVPVPTLVASTWSTQKAVDTIVYVLQLFAIVFGTYQIVEIKSGQPLPVTPVPPTNNTQVAPVTPISPPAPAYVTTDDLRKALAESEDRIAKRILDELK